MKIDLNCDLGESFGIYRLGADEEMLQLVSSANIACGFHAGDPNVMRRTVRLAIRHGVAIGAHPGYPDLPGFGRRIMHLTPDELAAAVLYQLGALNAMARAEGARLHHVKAHGALYNQAMVDESIAAVLADAFASFDEHLLVFTMPESALYEVCLRKGLRTAREGFADRLYTPDGKLVDRRLPGAVLEDPLDVAQQALKLVHDGRVETICLHGDTPEALRMARAVRQALEAEGVMLCPL